MMNRRQLMIAAAAGLIAPMTYAGATKTHTVRALTRDPDYPDRSMLFSPHILRIQPGDSVLFTAANPGHNSQTTDGMLPDGAEPWRGPFGKDLTVRLETPGYYGYHCLPHRSMGMVGLIVVEGSTRDDNLAAAQAVAQPARAQAAWESIWAEVAATRT